MSDIILFVFEGAKTEVQIFNNLQKIGLLEKSLICATYNTNIYDVFRRVEEDEFLDIVEVIRERSQGNKCTLEGVSRDDISEVYLFFDYDGHAPKAKIEKIEQMLAHFNEETENGSLYISYPMVEALKHLKQDVSFDQLTANINYGKKYKHLVSTECDACYLDLTLLKFEHWAVIIEEHCKKINFIMLDSFSFPNHVFSQEEIFNKQLEQYIEPDEKLAVLSAFPVFLLDYFGVDSLCKKIFVDSLEE